MSHFPYRRPPQADSSLRSDPGSYGSSDRRHASADRQFFQAPQDSFSTSYPSSSSSSSSSSSRVTWTKESAVDILSSCGLKPSDLALLAEMPEDSLTVESLPRVLQQIKGRRGTVKQQPPSSSSSSSSSYTPADLRPPASSWDRPLGQQPQHQVSSSADLDRWGNRMVFSSARAAPSSSPSSSSAGFTLDFPHRPATSDHGKNSASKDYKPGPSDFIRPARDYRHRAGPAESGRSAQDPNRAPGQDYDYRTLPTSRTLPLRTPPPSRTNRDLDPPFSQGWLSYSSAGPDKTSRQTHPPQPGPPAHRLPPQERAWSAGSSEAPPTRSSMPSKQNALDFHGSTPPSFPYSCSLCAITVMSEKVWLKHINGPLHADGQLNLLQQFPGWDCRLETVGRADSQSEKRKDDRKPAEKPPSSSHSSNSSQQKKNPPKKGSEKSKVVCVKFAANSVDEASLKKMVEPFGRIVTILMFPSLAFVEMGSVDQAKDLANYYCSNPPTVSGGPMEFRISNTFNFLQSSSVVSFTPAPSGEDGRADLLSIIKRFGSPLYTLFLPSKAFVEMKEASEAQKLVNFYSSNSLKINNDLLKVAFSGEYKSLMRLPSAQKYEEDTSRTRSPSKERDTRRRRSRDRSRSRSRERKTRNRSKSPKEEQSRTRSRSRSRSRERKTRTRSKSRDRRKSESAERSRTESKSESKSIEKCVREEEASESSPDPGPVQGSRPAEDLQAEEEEEEEALSADNSDIEGMEVIGEDGEELQQEEMEVIDGAEDQEEEEEEDRDPAGTAAGGGGDEEEQQEAEHQEETQSQHDDDESEPGWPLDLDSCITLDELQDDECDHPDEEVKGQPRESQSSGCRVLYFRNIPLDSLSDVEFVGLVKDHGKAVRFLRIHQRRSGFVEMASSAEADRALKALTAKPMYVNGCRVLVQLSHSYDRLSSGRALEDESPSRRSAERDQSRSSRRRRLDRESRRSAENKTPEKNVRTTRRRKPADKTKENESEDKEPETTRSTEDPQTEIKPEHQEPEELSADRRGEHREEDPEKKETEPEMDQHEEDHQDKDVKVQAEEQESEGKEPASATAPDVSSEKPGPESESVDHQTEENQLKMDQDSKRDPEAELKTSADSEKDQVRRGRRTKRKGARRARSAPQKKDRKTESQSEEVQEQDQPEEVKDSGSPRLSGEPPEPEEQQDHGPEGGAAEPQKPTRPVGTEFVRPVVGYFCNLCQLIYVDEDEAKQEHCSSLEHYRRYQEKTGTDPWAS